MLFIYSMTVNSSCPLGRLWSVPSLKELHCIRTEDSKLVTLFSILDITNVITGSENGTVKVWNLDGLFELATFAIQVESAK